MVGRTSETIEPVSYTHLTTPDNDKSKLIEIYANTLKCSSLNLSEKVKFNSGGRVVAGSNPVTPTDGKAW